jgi:ATP-dependent Lhr-like helicase
MGTVAYNTFERLLNNFCRESLEIKSLGGVNPYFIILKLGKGKFEQLEAEILSLCQQRIVNEHLVADSEAPEIQKYDKFIPYPLLRQAFATDYLNMEEVRRQIALW